MIALRCTCGKKLKVPDNMAGRTGKCPGCGAPVPIPRAGFVDEDGEDVAADNSPLELGDDPAPPKQRPPAVAVAPEAPGTRAAAASGPPISCPRCGTAYGAGAILCPRCAVDLRTGNPIAGVVPGHVMAPKPVGADADTPFWRITLDLFRKPAETLRNYPLWFERPAIQLPVFALFLLANFSFQFLAGASPQFRTLAYVLVLSLVMAGIVSTALCVFSWGLGGEGTWMVMFFSLLHLMTLVHIPWWLAWRVLPQPPYPVGYWLGLAILLLPWFAAARFVFRLSLVRAALACVLAFAAITALGYFVAHARIGLTGLTS